ncbi:MAG: hypothetical protein ACRDPF_03195 [Streptosporangiaceae bacterium]
MLGELPAGAGVRIFQGVRPAAAEDLPRGHRVGALVVVHPTVEGDLALPTTVAEELAWTRACDAVRTLRGRLPGGRPASARAVAVLVAATAGK